MIEAECRSRFQIHLSTSVILTLTAGLLLFANLEASPSYMGTFEYGWPFMAYECGRTDPSQHGIAWIAVLGDFAISLVFLAMAAAVLEWFMRSKKKPWFPALLAIALGGWPAVVAGSGYNVYLRYGAWLFSLPFVVILCTSILSTISDGLVFGLWPRKGLPSVEESVASNQRRLHAAMLCVLVFFGSWDAGLQFRKAICREICDKSKPLVSALEAYRRKNGDYPNSLADVPAIAELTRQAGISVRQGKFLPKGGIDVGNLCEADLTIYLSPSECAYLVPIEFPSITSFTRFSVYARSRTEGWTQDCILWNFEAIGN